jgi:hypothetical protein
MITCVSGVSCFRSLPCSATSVPYTVPIIRALYSPFMISFIKLSSQRDAPLVSSEPVASLIATICAQYSSSDAVIGHVCAISLQAHTRMYHTCVHGSANLVPHHCIQIVHSKCGCSSLRETAVPALVLLVSKNLFT